VAKHGQAEPAPTRRSPLPALGKWGVRLEQEKVRDLFSFYTCAKQRTLMQRDKLCSLLKGACVVIHRMYPKMKILEDTRFSVLHAGTPHQVPCHQSFLLFTVCKQSSESYKKHYQDYSNMSRSSLSLRARGENPILLNKPRSVQHLIEISAAINLAGLAEAHRARCALNHTGDVRIYVTYWDLAFLITPEKDVTKLLIKTVCPYSPSDLLDS